MIGWILRHAVWTTTAHAINIRHMVLRGYYASVSLGCEILASAFNLCIGVSMMVVGMIVILDPVQSIGGMATLGWLSISEGFLAVAAGGLAILGSCSEMPRSIRIGTYFSVLALMMGATVAGVAYSGSKDLSTDTRMLWTRLENDDRHTIEEALACCGFASTSELATPDCKSDLACREPFEGQLGDMMVTIAMMAGITAGMQIVALFCGCCVFRKMKHQQKKDVIKDKKRFVKEGRKLEHEKHKRSKRMAKYRDREARRTAESNARRDSTGPAGL